MASPHSSAPSSDTSLPHVPAPQVDTQVILPPVVLPTPPAFAPRLSITAQLTRPAYNFTGNNYSAWAYGFELFLESHNLYHHLMEDPLPLRDPSYDSWSQSDSAIITWMLHSIEQNIAESLARIKPTLSLWQTLETMYANQTNIGRVVEIFETLLTLKQGDLSLQAHFGRMQSLIQEVNLYQPPTIDLVTLKRYRAELCVSIYLSGLRPSIASQLRGSLLFGDHVPSITTIFSAALRVTTGMPSPPLPFAPGDMTRRNREVVDCKRYRVKNNSKLTHFRKFTRIEGYNGKYGSNPQGIKQFLDVFFKFDQIGREIDGRNWGKWYFMKVDFKTNSRNQKSSKMILISWRNRKLKWREIFGR